MEEFGIWMHTEAAQGCYCMKRSARRLVFCRPNLVQTEPEAMPCVDLQGGSPESGRCLGSGAGGEAQNPLRVCSAPPGWAGAVPSPSLLAWEQGAVVPEHGTSWAARQRAVLQILSKQRRATFCFLETQRKKCFFPKSCSSEATCNGELSKLGVPPATSSAKTKPWQMVVALRSAPARVCSGSRVHEPQFCFLPLEVRAV